MLKRNEHLSTVTDSDARELNICPGSSGVKISFGISWVFLIYSGVEFNLSQTLPVEVEILFFFFIEAALNVVILNQFSN